MGSRREATLPPPLPPFPHAQRAPCRPPPPPRQTVDGWATPPPPRSPPPRAASAEPAATTYGGHCRARGKRRGKGGKQDCAWARGGRGGASGGEGEVRTAPSGSASRRRARRRTKFLSGRRRCQRWERTAAAAAAAAAGRAVHRWGSSGASSGGAGRLTDRAPRMGGSVAAADPSLGAGRRLRRWERPRDVSWSVVRFASDVQILMKLHSACVVTLSQCVRLRLPGPHPNTKQETADE